MKCGWCGWFGWCVLALRFIVRFIVVYTHTQTHTHTHTVMFPPASSSLVGLTPCP